MDNCNSEFDNVLAKVTSIASNQHEASQEAAGLVSGIQELKEPLKRLRQFGGSFNIELIDRENIDREWAALREKVNFAEREMEARDSQAHTKALLVWLKVFLIKILHSAKKLFVLVNLELKHPRPGYSTSERDEIRFAGLNKIEAEYRQALGSVEDGLAGSYQTTPSAPNLAEISIRTVYEQEDFTMDVVDRSELSACQEELQKFKQALQTAHKKMVTPKMARMQKLEAEGRYSDAEKECRELIEIEEDHGSMGMSTGKDAAILELKYSLAEFLLGQQKYDEAESTARKVWETRKLLLGDASKSSRSSLIQVCRILRAPRPVEENYTKYREAHHIHWKIWMDSAEGHDMPWRIENGYHFTLGLAEKKQYREAVIIYAEVREAEKAIKCLGPDETSIIMQSRHQLGEQLGEMLCGAGAELLKDAVSILKPLWEEKATLLEPNTESLATAELLATSLAAVARWKEEEEVRSWICKTRRADLPNDRPKLIESLLKYGKALLRTKKFEKAAHEFKTVCEHHEIALVKANDRQIQDALLDHIDDLLSTRNIEGYVTDVQGLWKEMEKKRKEVKDCQILEARHYYAEALCGNERYNEAEAVILGVWQAREKILKDKKRDKLTLESGHLYGVVLLKQAKFVLAEPILETISDLRGQVIGPDQVETFESLFEYGNALLGQDDRNKWQKAENIFSQSWKYKDLKRAPPATAYDTILDIGYSLAYTLRKLEKFKDALTVMQDVWDRKKNQLGVDWLDDNDPYSIMLSEMKKDPVDNVTPKPLQKRKTIREDSLESAPAEAKDKLPRDGRVKEGRRRSDGKKAPKATKRKG